MRAVRRRLGAVVLPLLLAGSGCVDDFFHAAGDGPARVAVTFRQASGGSAAAFDAADNVAVEIRAGGETLFAGTVDVTAAGGPIEARVDVDLPDGQVTARVSVDLRLGNDDLFTGEGDATLGPGATTEVTLNLEPVVNVLDLVTPPTFTVYGQTVDLEGRALFATGDEVSGLDVAWTSLDPQVVAVASTTDGGWRATALTDGSATLRATAGNRSNIVVTEVRAEVTSVEVVPSSVDLAPGATAQLSAVLRDAGGATIPGRSPSWTSSDAGVATVSSSGLVSAVAPGTAEVTASADGASGRATVSVRRPGPDVTTLSPTNVRSDGATFRARVDPGGSSTSVVFEYGLDPDLSQPATTSPVSVSGSSGPVDVSRDVSGLAAGATYHVRAVATNGAGTTTGQTVSFATPPAPAVPTSLAGTFTGGVLLTWLDNSGIETRFEIERELVQAFPGQTSGSDDGPAAVFVPVATVGADVTQFEDTSPPAGELRYRVRACNDDGCSPWTLPLTWFYGVPPLVQTRPATNVGNNDAVVSAFVNPQNAPTIVYWEVTFDPSFTTPPPMIFPASGLSAGEGNIDVVRSTLATSLNSGTTYYVRAIAVNTWGSAVGSVLSFMTGGGG